MKFSVTKQEKGDLLIQVTVWADLTVFTFLIHVYKCLLYLFIRVYLLQCLSIRFIKLSLNNYTGTLNKISLNIYTGTLQ